MNTETANPTLGPHPLRRAALEASALMKVLSNPDRLLLLCELAPGERKVGELEAATGIHQPTLSQQLTVLRSQGLVRTRREGKNIHYRIASPQALALMETLYQQFCGPAAAAAAQDDKEHDE
ncbi:MULTISPECIES: metalloregulator ArsR/SmtB family transcription factor [Ramlibacter]|uniref:Helix-turn-helix transcriptional regulator n=1 Tax=Ramlibacter aquaticus TaxID=2780094 RepID=A0ABR9SHQ1_9BURK|nr:MULTISPECIES: metalloregulator ArsR/SmtB family transcription factor [Ramlibacter]MBE7941557.1 helix-turn-helix transcriptional regulator [Ramlibacter aquaticus]